MAALVNCRRVATALAHGTLTGDERAALRTHAAACPACAVLWQREAAIDAVLCSLGPAPVPTDLGARAYRAALEAAAADAEQPSFLATLVPLGLRAAVAAAGVAAVLLALAPERPSQPVLLAALVDDGLPASAEEMAAQLLGFSPTPWGGEERP